jgi:hypothetical protein
MHYSILICISTGLAAGTVALLTPFWEANVTLSGDNLTIREILTGIAMANGNALWIVRLNKNEFEGSEPRWGGEPIDEYGHSPLNTRWRFIPLDEKLSHKSLNRTRN